MRALLPLLLVVIVLAGCAAPAATPAPASTTAPAATRTSAVEGAVKPATLEAMKFRLGGALAKGGPAYGDGEPSIASSLDGALYVSFPGCDKDVGPGFITPVDSKCQVGPVFRSDDAGKTWKRLLKDDGKLAEDGVPANGDADVAVDAGGWIYVSNLGSGIETQRSEDGGASWINTGNVVPKDSRGVDRNWMAAAEKGHVIHNWMGGAQNKARGVGIVATFDGGSTYSNVSYIGKNIGWEGSVQFAPGTNGKVAYIPFTEPIDAGGLPPFGLTPTGDQCRLMVGKTEDGGLTWNVSDTKVAVKRSGSSFHFSCVMMAPALAVTGDGHVVYVYSEEVPDPAGVTNTGAVVKMIASDDGVAWEKPIVISKTPSAIFPWAAGGADDRVAITYFADTLPGDPDRTGMWDLRAALVDVHDGKVVESILDPLVHQGGICAEGGACFTTGTDRALLDYFENAVLPDGRLAVVYPADPAQGGKFIEIRTAVQEGGSLLFEPAMKST